MCDLEPFSKPWSHKWGNCYTNQMYAWLKVLTNAYYSYMNNTAKSRHLAMCLWPCR